MKPKALSLVGSLVIAYSAAAIGNLATIPNIPTWYATLEKAPFNPPNWVFGPVWTVLYTLMGVSLWLVWTAKTSLSKKRAYIAFGSQLALNALWSLVFFGAHQLWLSVAIIVVLLAAILWTMYEFHKISRLSAYLLIPYPCWAGFATSLTVAVALLN